MCNVKREMTCQICPYVFMSLKPPTANMSLCTYVLKACGYVFKRQGATRPLATAAILRAKSSAFGAQKGSDDTMKWGFFEDKGSLPRRPKPRDDGMKTRRSHDQEFIRRGKKSPFFASNLIFPSQKEAYLEKKCYFCKVLVFRTHERNDRENNRH